jgi:hypothetical protein
MKMVKSLLLGTAAGLVAMTGAQAADLPVKAKPVQYVKICSLYGAGFYYIPGTDTCIKIGGFLRAEVNVNANGSFAQYNRINFDDRVANRYVTRTRGAVTLDARSQTEYGTLRSYMVLAMQIDNGTPNAPGGTGVGSAAVGGSDVRTFSNAFFIQFAGFTAGSTTSFFDFDTQAYSNQTNVLGSSLAGAGTPLVAYTAQLGNGLSATIEAEDEGGRRAYILNTTAPAATSFGGKRIPDFVANLRLDQAWGSAQLMGAVHNSRAAYNGGAGIGTGNPDDKTGYAFGAGLKLNLPMLGKGDYAIAQGSWSKGATSYSAVGMPGIAGSGAVPNFAISNGVAGSLTTAYGLVTDSVFTGAGGGQQELTRAWSVTGGYEHNWTSQWKTSLYGAYGRVMYSDAASAIIAATAATPGLLAGTAGSASFSFSQIGTRTVWTPVTNLDLSVDLIYNKLNTAFAGSGTAAGGTYQDKSWFAGMFRAQRNFYP